jgi:hypothetical protein
LFAQSRRHIILSLIASQMSLDQLGAFEARNVSGSDEPASGVRIQSEVGESRLEKIATFITHAPNFVSSDNAAVGSGGFFGWCAMVDGGGRAG